jgi:hypothetical protein
MYMRLLKWGGKPRGEGRLSLCGDEIAYVPQEQNCPAPSSHNANLNIMWIM